MTILHYYIDPKTYVEITDKFIGVIELFNMLIKDSPSIKDFDKTMSKDVDAIKSELAAIKKKVCINDGCEKTISGHIDVLSMTLCTVKINILSKIHCKDE